MNKELATILLVEDSLADIALTKALIKVENIFLDLVVARDSTEAYKILNDKTCQIDLVILDFNLPKVSGLEVLLNIKEKFTIPVLMFSGSDAPPDKEKAKELGATDYMVKPFDVSDFKGAIEKIETLELVGEEKSFYLYTK